MRGFKNRAAPLSPHPVDPNQPRYLNLNEIEGQFSCGRDVFQVSDERSFLGKSAESFLTVASAYSDCVLPSATVSAHHLVGMRWCSETGLLVIDDGSVLVDSAMDQWRLETMDLTSCVRPNRIVTEAVATSIWHDWAHNYYHWLVDCLPRTFAVGQLTQHHEMTLLVPERINAIQEFTLRQCLPPGVSIRKVASGIQVAPRRFVFPTFVSQPKCGFIPSLPLAHVRNTLLPCASAGQMLTGVERLFVSRARCNYRRITNETAVVALLKRFGFVSIQLEELPWGEQVAAFRNAQLVVAPHGAGLANLVFGSPPLRVLELFPCRTPEPHFFFLCEALSLDHYHLLCDSFGPHDDFEVDVSRLREAVVRLLDNERR